MNVKGNHPLAEILQKKLFGIENVPKKEARKMVGQATKSAVEYHTQAECKLQTKLERVIELVFNDIGAYGKISDATKFTFRQMLKQER